MPRHRLAAKPKKRHSTLVFPLAQDSPGWDLPQVRKHSISQCIIVAQRAECNGYSVLGSKPLDRVDSYTPCRSGLFFDPVEWNDRLKRPRVKSTMREDKARKK